MSDHDPLCPNSAANSPQLKWCDCDFIYTVRADERSKWDGSTVVLASEVTKMLDAARADEREKAAHVVEVVGVSQHAMFRFCYEHAASIIRGEA